MTVSDVLPLTDVAGSDSDTTHLQVTRRWAPAGVWVNWFVIEIAAVVLLAGRYNWSGADRPFALRGWALSAYLAVLALPVTYHLLHRWTRNRWVAPAVTGLLFVVLTIPYRWVGFDRWFYYEGRTRPWYIPPDEVPWPKTAFLPGGPWSTFPHDIPLFLSLIAVTVLIVVLVLARHKRIATGGGRAFRSTVVMAGLAVVVIILQTFLHSGVRGPQAYMTHFQGPPVETQWYAVSHYDDGSGVVIADQFIYSAMEQYFHGVAIEPNNMMIRRPASFYVAAQASYFTNTYAVWIVMNIVLWVAVVLAGYGFVRRLLGPRPARYFAALLTVGPGFVTMVGTSGMYLAGYAVVMFALYLTERLLVDGASGRWEVALLAASLGLCALTYDLTVIFPVLVLYAVLRGARWRSALLSVVGAYLIYRGFLFIHDVLLGIETVNTNTVQMARAKERVLQVAADPGQWSGALGEAIDGFMASSARMFFYVPLVLAILGALRLRGRASVALVIGLLGTTFATVAFLRIGDELIGWHPRFAYPSYPAVYMLAALALDAIMPDDAHLTEPGIVKDGPPRRLSDGGSLGEAVLGPLWSTSIVGWTRKVFTWSVLGALLVMSNMDSFGYPRLAYEAMEGTEMGTFLTRYLDGSVGPQVSER